jgi:hypothetical protein
LFGVSELELKSSIGEGDSNCTLASIATFAVEVKNMPSGGGNKGKGGQKNKNNHNAKAKTKHNNAGTIQSTFFVKQITVLWGLLNI